MKELFCRPAAKYVVMLFVALGLYAVALVVSLRWLQAGPAEPWKYAIAVLPVLPALGIPLAIVRTIQSMDELQLRIQLESLAFGFALAAIATFTYGFLQNAGLPEVSWVWVWPVMAVCWMLGQLAARRRYR
jgi:O-antigen/teichoic acid export membrane protein